MRADQRLLELGLAESRTHAQRLIAEGRVYEQTAAGRTPLRKPSQRLADAAQLEIVPVAADRYVCRGALKLLGALAHSGVAANDKTCLDLGQSTGGFSQVLVEAGARRVIGIEVGHGQLHARLREEPRIHTLEGLNARHLSAEKLGGEMPAAGFDLIVADLSFISLTLVLPATARLLGRQGHLLALVKPQFELGPQALGKGGIVRDASRYAGLEGKIRESCEEAGLRVLDWFDSPITGGDGNREFFILASRA